MRLALVASLAFGLAACAGSSTADTDAPELADAATASDVASADDSADDVADDSLDAGSDEGDATADAEPDAGDATRGSLSVCWTDARCPRALAVAHGGSWDAISAPYDSNAAIAQAWALGIDGVKIDVRVTKDDVPVIAHSSPIAPYESALCSGRKIEESTAAEITTCLRLPSLTETFQRLDDVLAYLRGKMVVELTVKEPRDYARAIAAVRAAHAEDYAFLEISTAELANVVPTLPGGDSVRYLVNVGSNVAEIDTIVDVIKNPRAFMVEIDPTVSAATLTATKLHPAGVRSFTYDSSGFALEPALEADFERGYDVVSANSGGNLVAARIAVNQRRGVTPP